MTFRLYFDEDSEKRAVVEALRNADFDCLTTGEAGRRSSADADQLAFATERGRVLFTRNARDYRTLHATLLSEGRSHAGIILLIEPRTPIAVQVRALLNLAALIPPEAMVNRIEFLLNYA